MENQPTDGSQDTGTPVPPPPASTPVGGQAPVPNASAVLVLGIISIPTCICYGIVGLILGIIALVLSSKAMQLYKASPESYSLSSYKNLNAGRICAIIGTILSGLYFLFIIVYFLFVGAAVFSGMGVFEEMMNSGY